MITITVIEMAAPEELIPIEITPSPDFKLTYANGIFGGLTSSNGTMIFFLDRPYPEMKEGSEMGSSHIKRELQVEIHLSHQTFIVVRDWMGKHIERVNMGREQVDA